MKYSPYKQPRTTSFAGPEYILVPKSGSNSIRRAINDGNANNTTGRPYTPANFVFSFVRHPLTRLVSAYVEKVLTGKTRAIVPRFMHEIPPTTTLPEFVDWLWGFPKKGVLNDHFCPQSWLLKDEKDLQWVGILENVAEDWKVLMDRGLPPLPHHHKTPGIKTWQEMLDKETEAKARLFYRGDFERWEEEARWE